MIAEMFVRDANGLILSQSAAGPSFAPFTNLVQNEENDLDFMVTTSVGVKRMELVEFAPLKEYGPRFDDVPRQLHQGTKADLALELIGRKSTHQGGPDRILLVYKTEQAFWIDPITTEIVRRALAEQPPAFERIYCISPHDELTGSVSEIYPGRPHHICSEWSDAQLRERNVQFFHTEELTFGWEGIAQHSVANYGTGRITIRCSIERALTLLRSS